VQDTALNGLQAVLYRRNGSLKNDIRSIVQKPVLVHACQMIFDCVAEVSHEVLVEEFVDDNVSKYTNKLQNETADEQTVAGCTYTEIVHTQANNSAKEDNQSEIFK
jgi:hypothetical protein